MPRGVYDRSKIKRKKKAETAEKKPRKYGNRYTKAKELAAQQNVPVPAAPSAIDYSMLNYFQSLVGARTVVAGSQNSALIAKLDTEIGELLDEFRSSRKKFAAPAPKVERVKAEKTAPAEASQAPAPVPFNPPQAATGG